MSGKELGKDYQRRHVRRLRQRPRSSNLFKLRRRGNRKEVDFDDKRLRDGVADNLRKYDLTESESLLFGTGFGVTPDVSEGPTARSTSCPTARASCTRSRASSPRMRGRRRIRRRPRVACRAVKERIDELARQITQLREAYYDGADQDERRGVRRARGRAARAARRAPGPDARPEPARAGRRARRAACAGAPQPADALAREGDPARAGRRLPGSLPRPAGRRDAEARRLQPRARLRGRPPRAGDHPRGRDDGRRRDRAGPGAGRRRAGQGRAWTAASRSAARP